MPGLPAPSQPGQGRTRPELSLSWTCGIGLPSQFQTEPKNPQTGTQARLWPLAGLTLHTSPVR